MRILLIFYSQSGDATQVASTLAAALAHPEIEVQIERLRPTHDYPFPWRSIGRFFAVLPDCHLGPLPELEPPRFDPDQKPDLIVLVYQVWFLAPSLPIQSLLASAAARVFRDTRVITVSVSRNMWQSASLTMKEMLRALGARHIDGAVLTHQGAAWATFVTTPRFLLYGKSNRFLGFFPAPGLSPEALERVRRFGEAIVVERQRLKEPAAVPLLRGLGAVEINHRYLLPERLGFYYFQAWARFLRLLGRLGRAPLLAGAYLFAVCLVAAIVIGIPLTLLARLLTYPLMSRWIAAYAERLAEPSGC